MSSKKSPKLTYFRTSQKTRIIGLLTGIYSKRFDRIKQVLIDFLWELTKDLLSLKNGEGGIRTPGTLTSTLVFETSSISHSDTSPFT